MDENFDQDQKTDGENIDRANQYVELTRFVEGGHFRRFEEAVRKFNVVEYELTEEDDRPSKSLIFYAIEAFDEGFVRLLLNMELPLDQKYTVMIENSDGNFAPKNLDALSFAKELNRAPLIELIERHKSLAPFNERYLRVLEKNEVRLCDRFIRQLHNDQREKNLAIEGFFYAARLGSVRLLDYFLSQWKIDINLEKLDGDHKTTALLTAITFSQNEAAKFLLFRKADPSRKGQFNNALVTSLHFNLSNDLIKLLLEKHADLTERHPDFPKQTLREFCVLTNRVEAKKQLDSYIIGLVSKGDFKRLKWIVEHGYPHVFLHLTPSRDTRILAKERYFDKIVQLIDVVVDRQTKAKIKMNY